MVELGNLAPDLAKLLHVQPSTLVLLILIVTTAANAGARLIPNTATGTLGVIRKVCSFIGVYISSRVAPGVTVNDVATAAATTPPIDTKVQEQADAQK